MKLKGILTALGCALSLASQGLTAAELPELGNPSTGSGQPTTASFHGGATADSGSSYPGSFTPDDAVDVLGEIHVESGHVSTTGNLYVVASDGLNFYLRLEDGSFVPWDGDVATLQAMASGIPLAAVEELNILQNLVFRDVGVSSGEIYFYLAYDSQQVPGEIYYSGDPITVTINEGPVDTLQLYQDTISQPIVQNNCIVCHVSGGLAGTSKLVYQPGNVPGYLQTNYQTLVSYILNEPGGSELILSKPLGVVHGGGVRLTEKSAEYAALSAFVSAVVSGGGGGGGSQQALFDGVEMLDNQGTLRKAALLLAGRLPTEAELTEVDGADEAGLRQAVRDLMTGEGFEQFLHESANDQLLTLAYRNNLFQIVDRYFYPNSMQYYLVRNTPGSPRQLTGEALAMEPLKLISHVVMEERPYTEILTADYIMVNPYSAEIYGGDVPFDDPDDPNEWREGEITEYYRCTVCARNENAQFDIPTDYPHAGILNSPAFLARFPSTSTNRNRARARWAYYFFLGVDIEGLAERTQDPDALADENNPTLNNPNCTVCHDIMDPVAGSFQNYGDDGYYRDQRLGLDALPASYKRDPAGLYQPGDIWYADMLTPGFGTELAPSPDNSLQWLAQQFVNDSRFGTGTVNFWFPAMLGREAQAEPENPEDADYAIKQAAYAAEQELIQALADDFVGGSHGNGTHNLKDLLADLVMSDYFRAAASDSLTGEQQQQLAEVGVGRLLTPEQLNRKLLEVGGYEWAYGRFNTLNEVYSLVYGGIDSLGITERATELTTMMSTVVTTMANEASCAMVAQDFGRPATQRYLFPLVELSNLPTTGEAAVRSNIQYLHDRLLGESLALDDPEIDATFALFADTWQARVNAGKGPAVSSNSELCLVENTVNPVTSDPNQTLRSWVAVVNYLLRDYRFIHE